jgi:hypothetical protein
MASAAGERQKAEAKRSRARLLANCWTLPCTWSHSRCIVESEEGASSMWLRKTPEYRILIETHALSRDWKWL